MPLKTPLHESCLKKGSLCSSCSSKVKSGEVEDWEVEVLRALLAAFEKRGGQASLRYESSAIAGSTLYIALEGDPVDGLEEEITRMLSAPRVARVRVIFYRGGEEGLLEKVYGQKILSINRVYDPDGSIQLYVKIPRPDPGADKLASLLLRVRVQSVKAEDSRSPEKPGVAKRADVASALKKLFS